MRRTLFLIGAVLLLGSVAVAQHHSGEFYDAPKSAGGGGTGDVSGGGSSTDNAIPTWDGTGGDTLQNSTLTWLSGVAGADGLSIPDQMGTWCASTNLGPGVTTTAVAGASNCIILTGDAGGNSIATLTNGTDGQYLIIQFTDSNITIVDDDTHTADTIDLSGTATNFVAADDDVLMLVWDYTSWYEVSRTVSAGGGGFDGDLATDTALQDSSDNVIDIVAGEDIQWISSTVIDGDTDGYLQISNAAGTLGGWRGPYGGGWYQNVNNEVHTGASTTRMLNATWDDTAGGTTPNIRFYSNSTRAFWRMHEYLAVGWTSGSDADGDQYIGISGFVVDVSGDDEENFVSAFGSTSYGTNKINANYGGTFRMGDMDIDQTTTGRPGAACDDQLDGALNYDEPDTAATTRMGRSAEMCVEEYDGTTSTYAWRSVVDLYGSIYMSTGSGAISYTTTYAILDDATSAWGIGDAVNGFALDATGKLNPVDDASGRYQVTWQVSFVGTASTVYTVSLTNDNNTSQEPQCTSMRSFGTGTPQTGSMSGTCIITVSYAGDATDDVYLVMKSDNAGGANATISNAQLVLRRL